MTAPLQPRQHRAAPERLSRVPGLPQELGAAGLKTALKAAADRRRAAASTGTARRAQGSLHPALGAGATGEGAQNKDDVSSDLAAHNKAGRAAAAPGSSRRCLRFERRTATGESAAAACAGTACARNVERFLLASVTLAWPRAVPEDGAEKRLGGRAGIPRSGTACSRQPRELRGRPTPRGLRGRGDRREMWEEILSPEGGGALGRPSVAADGPWAARAGWAAPGSEPADP